MYIDKKIYYVLVVFLCGGLQFFATELSYLRELVWQQPWRLLSAHWVHVGWWHYLLNMAALVCLPALFYRVPQWLIGLSAILISLMLSIAIYVFSPNVYGYAGLSGVLHGLYVVAALYSLQDKEEDFFAVGMLVAIVLKLASEAYFGAMPATAQLIGRPVMIESHRYGAICGGIVGLGFIWYQRYRK